MRLQMEGGAPASTLHASCRLEWVARSQNSHLGGALVLATPTFKAHSTTRKSLSTTFKSLAGTFKSLATTFKGLAGTFNGLVGSRESLSTGIARVKESD